MDDEHLWQAIGNVMLYGVLQIVSLVVLFAVLWHKLHISAVRQLTFVLEKQGEQVQTKPILWVFYNVQISLQHFGKNISFVFLRRRSFTFFTGANIIWIQLFATASDYTFKFAWLHKAPVK